MNDGIEVSNLVITKKNSDDNSDDMNGLCNNNSLINNLNDNFVNKKYEYLLTFPLHIFLHILLLSICETILFFSYISNIESEALMNKISQFLKMINNEILNYEFVSFSYDINNNDLMDYENNLHNNYNEEDKDRKDNNNTLLNKSCICSIVIFCTFIIYYISLYTTSVIRKYKISIYKIIIEHLILMLFIGIFEYWFFNNIIMKYISITNGELIYVSFNCLMKTLNEKEPNLNLNSTLYSDCMF